MIVNQVEKLILEVSNFEENRDIKIALELSEKFKDVRPQIYAIPSSIFAGLNLGFNGEKPRK